MRVSVIGLGKIGLPLAALYACRGLTVIGCDIAPHVVEAVNAGHSPVGGEPGLAEAVAQSVAAGRLQATTDTTYATSQSDVVVVIVPLMIDENRRPDFRSIDAATTALARGLHRDHLVIYETTLPVGTTRGRFGEMLEGISGLIPGRDFWLAFSPERVYSGRVFSDLQCYPKVVGGVDSASASRAAEFYRLALGAEVLEVESAELAEFTKLIETTYRDVNIALANEFARRAAELGLDVTLAIRVANTQPFSHIHTPGVGVGGHCIPVYPYFLMDGHGGEESLSLPRIARRINEEMPDYTVDLLARALNGLVGRRVLILGLAYRENVKETAFTAAKDLIAALKSHGAEVLLNDPLFSREEIEAYDVRSVELNGSLLVDAVILQCYHDAYRRLNLAQFEDCQVVLDGRNVLAREEIQAQGMQYLGIGR
jgi:nucleotide sugar dehydrogenase